MQVGIVGLGLIGGSLALDFRALGHTVLGVARRVETCALALERGAVDRAGQDAALLADADVVFLCVPLDAMRGTAEAVAPHLRPDAVLTDVGSAKATVVGALSPLWQRFVGGHPMAGKSEAGLEAAERGLFVGKPYVVTPLEAGDDEAVRVVEGLARSLGARVLRCQPEEHDRAVAWISHLPVMVSAGLVAAANGEEDPSIRRLAQALASTGFRDTSRVGGGVPELGLMMARHNREALLRSLGGYRQQLERIADIVEREAWLELEAFLEQTSAARRAFVPGS